MPILVDPINTIDDLLQAVQARFDENAQDAPAELKQLLSQEKIKPLWLAIWGDPNNLNYARRILKLPCTPEVMIDIIPMLRQINHLEQINLLRNYFLGTQRFDIVLSYFLKKGPHRIDYDEFISKLTEPFLSALLTGQLSDESVNHFAQFICGDSDPYWYWHVKLFFKGSDEGNQLYQSAINRTIMRNEQFARQMYNMIIATGTVPPNRQMNIKHDVSKMWTALYSHEQFRGITSEFSSEQQSASTYYDCYKIYLDPSVADQFLKQGDRRSIETVLKIAPEKLLTPLEDQEVLQPVAFISKRQQLLKQLLKKQPKLKQALLEQDENRPDGNNRPYMKTIKKQAPLTWWQLALRDSTIVLSILSLGVFNTLVWLLVSLFTWNTSTIHWAPTKYFSHRPFVDDKDIQLPVRENQLIELFAEIYCLAKQRNIPLQQEWNALLNSYIAYSSNTTGWSKSKKVFAIHALEDACLHVEKTGEVPANFMQLVEAVTRLKLNAYLTSPLCTSMRWFKDVSNLEVNAGYFGYLNRWLHQLQIKNPALRELQDAQKLVNTLLIADEDKRYARVFGPNDYLPEAILTAHPELALWTPINDDADDRRSRARLLVDTNVDSGAHSEDEVYNLLAFSTTVDDLKLVAAHQAGEQRQPQVQQPEKPQTKNATASARLFAIRQDGLIVQALASILKPQ